MTDETKKLFDAPWRVAKDDFDYAISSASNEPIVFDSGKDGEKNANRIARLPELYDKLMWAVVQKCPDAFLALDECRICPDKKCKYREIVELLRKVMDGE